MPNRPEQAMSDKLQRMLEKAKAKHARKRASDAILIDCERPEDVPGRVDVLIAAGTLTEAERPRCVFWPHEWNGTHDEWVLMMAKNTTPQDRQRQWEESAARAHALAMADPILAAHYRKNEKPDSL